MRMKLYERGSLGSLACWLGMATLCTSMALGFPGVFFVANWKDPFGNGWSEIAGGSSTCCRPRAVPLPNPASRCDCQTESLRAPSMTSVTPFFWSRLWGINEFSVSA